MSSHPNDPSDRSKVDIAPRQLPEPHEDLGAPFEQLNSAHRAEETGQDSASGGRLGIQPRQLPGQAGADSEIATMKEAMRLMVEEGQSREQVARKLKIAPLKLRHWENAYHEFLQKDLNEGEYHDTDAQLRDLPDDVKNRFHENWDQVMEKATERRVKVTPLRAKLMANPITRWFFRNEHGDLDFGVITGVTIVVLGLVFASSFISSFSNAKATLAGEDPGGAFVYGELGGVAHDPKLAWQTVVDFHKTPTWEEKLEYVIAPDRVRPLMEDWYRRHPEDIYYNRIGYYEDFTLTHDGDSYLNVAVEVSKATDLPGNEKPFYMAMKRTKSGYKVDWEVSSGYQPMDVVDYREQRPVTPMEFRFTIEKGDYFNFGFTSDDYHCFTATYVGLDRPFFIYGRKDDPTARDLHTMLEEVKPSMGAIVRVRYPEKAQADDQLILEGVVSKTWFRKYD